MKREYAPKVTAGVYVMKDSRGHFCVNKCDRVFNTKSDAYEAVIKKEWICKTSFKEKVIGKFKYFKDRKSFMTFLLNSGCPDCEPYK